MSDIIDFDKKIHVAKPTSHYIYGLVLVLVLLIVVIFESSLIDKYTDQNDTSEQPQTQVSDYNRNFLSFDDFYLNNLEGDKYGVHSFSLFKEGCTSVLYISDREETLTDILTSPQKYSAIFYNNGYFYSFIGCDYNESIKTSENIQNFIGNFESLKEYLNDNYEILEEKKQVYIIKGNIQISEIEYIKGGILLPSKTVEINNQTLYIYNDKTLVKKGERFFIFRNSYNLTKEQFYNNIKSVLGGLFL